MNTNEIYDDITKTIIALLEEHKDNWQMPWIKLGVDNDMARNPSTNKYYRGINQFLLSYMMTRKGYLTNQWATFQQIKKMGGNVIKGENSLPIIFYKTAYIDRNKKYYKSDVVKEMNVSEQMRLGIDSVPIAKLYRVFNIANQTENLDEQYYTHDHKEELKDFEKDQASEDLIKSTGAKIIERNSNRAYYNSADDTITLPNRNQFKGLAQPFYATALHELGHWTGHKSRLNRDMGGDFGSDQYAKEELVAELSSAFCCAHLGFTKTITNNVAYLNNWLGLLKADSKAIITASAQAQKSADYIIGGPDYCAYENR